MASHMHQVYGTEIRVLTYQSFVHISAIFRSVRKMRKETQLFCVRLSVHMGQLGSHWTDFCKIWY
jgi:hypothetical protein